jgi:hypothetical protein
MADQHWFQRQIPFFPHAGYSRSEKNQINDQGTALPGPAWDKQNLLPAPRRPVP